MYAEPVTTLSPELLTLWKQLHDRDGGLTGPFLHPAYAQAAAQVRQGVEVGVITHGDEVVGFLPYQRSRLGVGVAVGSRLCDMAGAVVRPDVVWSPEALVRGAGLRTLRLPGVPSSMAAFQDFQKGEAAAPVLDLARGFDAYRKERIDSGSSFIRQVERKSRKLERDLGPWRFEWHTNDDAVFETLLSWKAAQRKQTRTPNILHLSWARELLQRLRATDEDSFAGVLSALYVGDTLAAAHFGIRTRRVLHYWVPAYNHELSRYSPGLLALVELARAASERGIHRIDLGAGEERYKLRAATGALDMTMATVSTNAALRAATNTLDRARRWSRGSRLGELARAASRSMMRGSYRLQAALTSTGPLRGGTKAP
jgi:CelD/BcsL family acetyltransferase involved in cellulose biosynthesis